jgi:hypothetical protein
VLGYLRLSLLRGKADFNTENRFLIKEDLPNASQHIRFTEQLNIAVAFDICVENLNFGR